MHTLTTSLDSSLGPAVCRVCLCGESSNPYLGNASGESLISPCLCKGSMGLYHRSCLEHWLSMSQTYCCEICKFKYQIGRRKQSFWTYLRTHWVGADLPRSLSSECACLLFLLPSTVGGAVLCIETVAEMIREASEDDDYGKTLDILAVGMMGFLFVFSFGALVICTVVSYFDDFRKWQKKNVVLYVIDQLDREEETCCQSHNLPSESLRPLLIKKKLRKFICCGSGGSQKEDIVIPLHEEVLDVNPQLLEANVQATFGRERAQAFGSVIISPVSRVSYTPQPSYREDNISTSILVGTIVNTPDDMPTLSTFRPHYTVASAQEFYNSNKSLLLPMFKQLNDEGIDSPGVINSLASSEEELYGYIATEELVEQETLAGGRFQLTDSRENNKMDGVCFICGTSTQRSISGSRINAKMVKPCLCDVTCHHGCMVQRLPSTKMCNVCGATYNYIEYGSLKDFFVRYWCQYFTSFVALVLLFLLSVLALTNCFRKVDTFSLKNLFVLVVGVVLFGICIIFTWMCIKYTVARRIPRFHARYRQITVFDCDPRQTSQARCTALGGTLCKQLCFADEAKCRMLNQGINSPAEQGLLRPGSSTSHFVSSTPIGGSQVFHAPDVETAEKM